MKKYLWLIIILIILILGAVIFLADDIRLLFLPEGVPAERPLGP